MMAKKSPNPVDKYVGLRVRQRRVQMQMSQTELAKHLDVTFQQIQKYEKGANRVSASRLTQMANALKVPPAFFFENHPGDNGNKHDTGASLAFAKFIGEQGGMKVMEYWAAVSASERAAFGKLLEVFASRARR